MSAENKFTSNIWKSYLIRMFFWMHFVAAVMVPFYMEWGHIRFSQILFLNAWFMLWMFIFEVPTGTIADVFGRKKSMLAGTITAICGVVLYVSFPNFYNFVLAEFILAAAYTMMSGAEEALAYDSLIMINRQAESKKIFARMESFKLTGIIIGALAGGVIAKYWGLRMPLLLHAVPQSICAILVLSLKEPVHHDLKEKPGYRTLLKAGLQQLKKDKIIRVLILDMVSIGAFTWLIIWFYQKLLEHAGVDIIWFGLVHTLMCIGQIAVLESVGLLERLLKGKRRLLMLTAILSAVCFILLGIISSAWIVTALIVICASFGLARGPLFTNYLNKYFSSDKRAIMLSLVSMLRTFMIVLVNIIAGLLADVSISLTLILIGGAILVLLFVSRIKEVHLQD
ncbi:MAG: MFS transporter [Spirochaetes bacterium]|nr:MFS transporter [Spirochaetota bacterium]